MKEKITAFINEWIESWKEECPTLEDLLRRGYCSDLATLVWSYCGRSDEIIFHSCGDPVHVWIEYEGMHYDMQHPDGVDDWRKLAYFKDSPNAVLED